MATSNEAMVSALQEALGGGPSSEEGLDYARRILQQYQMADADADEDILAGYREQESEVIGALRQAQDRIRAQKGPTQGEFLLALGAGLGAPTKTGSIGETAGNVARLISPIAAEQREFAAGQEKALSDLDLAIAQAGMPVTQAEFALDKLDREIQGRLAQEALKTIARGGSGSRTGSKTREAKIADLMEGWNYSRRDAAALVDGFVDIEIVPQTGRARLINEIQETVTEVPLASLEEYVDEQGNLRTGTRPTARPSSPSGTANPGEVDTRTKQERDADLFVTQAFDEGASVWDLTEYGTGPKSWLYEKLSVPSSLVGGPVASQTIAARQGLMLASRDLAESLVDNPKKPVRLIEMALEAAGIEPGMLDAPPMMQARLVELDKYLYQKYLEYERLANSPNTVEDLRTASAANVETIGTFLRDLGVPKDMRRRSIFVPIDPTEAAEFPDLPKRPPAGSGFSDEAWNSLTPSQKARVVYLIHQKRGAQE